MSDLPMASELFVQMRKVEDRAYQKGWEQGRRNFVRNIDYEAAVARYFKRFGADTDERTDIEADIKAIVDAAFGIGGNDG